MVDSKTSKFATPNWLKILAVSFGIAATATTLGLVMPWNAASKAELIEHNVESSRVYQTKEEARQQHLDIERRQQETLKLILESVESLKK